MSRPAELLQKAIDAPDSAEFDSAIAELLTFSDTVIKTETWLTQETIKVLRRPDKLTPGDQRKLDSLFRPQGR